MMKFNVNNLSLELTRRCNMSCEHCLRGDAEDTDMPLHVVLDTLSHFEYIDNIIFTGGEPSIVPEMMMAVLNECKLQQIHVGSFYLATNGARVSDYFLQACDEWYQYAACNQSELKGTKVCPYDVLDDEGRLYSNYLEFGGVALSSDCFHDPIPFENVVKLQSRRYFKTDKIYGHGSMTVHTLAIGRAQQLEFAHPYDFKDSLEFYTDDYGKHFIEDVYVNVYGDVLPDVDLPYSVASVFKLGNVRERYCFENIYNHDKAKHEGTEVEG